MNPLVYVFASILLVTVSQLLFKHGITLIEQRPKQEGVPKWKSILTMLFQPHVFAGLFCNGLAAVGWLLALSNLELSYVFPFISLNYILVPVAAAWILKEKLSRVRMIGIGIICAGVFMIAFTGTDAEKSNPEAEKSVSQQLDPLDNSASSKEYSIQNNLRISATKE